MPKGVYQRNPKPFWQRFWDNVQHPADGCWEWTGARNIKSHYGVISLKCVVHLAHRSMWEFFKGPIPHGFHVLHKCDNPPCVRPDHLFIGTPADNMADCISKGRARGARPSLSLEQVREVRNLLSSKKISKADIAKKFSVSRGVISNIARNISWRNR